MHFTMNTLVLATLAIGQTYAASVGHAHTAFHSHARKHDHIQPLKRSTALSSTDASKLTSLGAQTGLNSAVNNGHTWLGEDGPYKSNFINSASEDLILVCWGVAGSWINAVQPTITASIASGESLTVSFADGASGACTAVYSDTELVNGQASNTWMEFTFGEYGVVDVSREVNMNGHSLSVVGPSCTTNMETCVFVCPSGTTCTTGYELLNCANGSQSGANYGTYDGSPSGGCGGMGSSATLTTTWS